MAGIRQPERVADDRGQMGQSIPLLKNLQATRVLGLPRLSAQQVTYKPFLRSL
jgi:hypothetical protein